MFVCSDTDYVRARGDERTCHPAALLAARGVQQSVYGDPCRLPRRRTSTCGPGRCSAWSANRARARPRSSTACPARLTPDSGSDRPSTLRDGTGRGRAADAGAGAGRKLARTDWGVVHQNPRDGLRMGVTAGANVGERLMAVGCAPLRAASGGAPLDWLDRVEIEPDRHRRSGPTTFSGGMQPAPADRPHPGDARRALVFMDEPTGGLDVSVQARLLDLAARPGGRRSACRPSLVTHDLAVARLLAHRLLVMQRRRGGGVRPDRTRCSTIRSIPTPSCSSPRCCSRDRSDADRRGASQDVHAPHAGRDPARRAARRGSHGVSRRVRRAHGPVRVGQVHAASGNLRELPAAARAHPHRARRRPGGHGRRRAARAPGGASPNDRLRQPVPPGDPAGAGVGCGDRAAPRLRRCPASPRWRSGGRCSRAAPYPERLWSLSPVTFSGGEQQRVKTWRAGSSPDFRSSCSTKPSASLDAAGPRRSWSG